MYKEERKSFKCESPPVEHPEYSLGFAFSRLLYKILLVPEVCLHLFKIHAMDGCEGVLGDGRGCVCGGLFCQGGVDLGNVLQTVTLMATTMELAFTTLIL